MTPETRIHELKLVLPPAPRAMGAYRPVIVVGNLAYMSGHAPWRDDGSRIVGRLGQDLDVEAGKAAARQCGLAMLSSLRAELGSLDRVRQVVKVLGLVNATPEFQQHPQVVNGCSELFIAVFGPVRGVGARSVAGVNSLPGGIAVEIESVLEVG